MARVYFTSGGSEANESAWKLARQYFVETGRPQKYKAIARWQRLSRRDAGGAVAVGADRLAAHLFAAAAAGARTSRRPTHTAAPLRGRGACTPRLRRRAGARHRPRGPGDGRDVLRRAGRSAPRLRRVCRLARLLRAASARSATSTTCCSSPTRCCAAMAAAAGRSPSASGRWSPTSSRSARRSPAAMRRSPPWWCRRRSARR